MGSGAPPVDQWAGFPGGCAPSERLEGHPPLSGRPGGLASPGESVSQIVVGDHGQFHGIGRQRIDDHLLCYTFYPCDIVFLVISAVLITCA